MKEEAVLLTAPNASSQDANLGKLLNFFGIFWRGLNLDEFFVEIREEEGSRSKSRLLCSDVTLFKVIDRLEHNPDYFRLWSTRVHSVFVYAGDNRAILQNLARRLTRDDGAVIRAIDAGAQDFRVSEHWADFCAVMTGVRVAATAVNLRSTPILVSSKHDGRNIISADDGAVFFTLDYENVAVFLSTCPGVIDIASELTSQNFDVREHFLSAVPVVLYIKWAFAKTCWDSPEATACMIIDDPLLKPSYGCVNFEELLSLMERHHFATNIAFIPWNWRRSNPNVARLFTQKPERYSISIHGSDHVAAEFGSRDRDYLYRKTKRAIRRMSNHEARTGISHDRVMVFPQGVFSEAAMDALKRSNLAAAVNTDVVSVDPHRPAIKISDVWDIAVMRYRDFPIFTRRYPAQEISNFAFDILLGKPCIIGVHHDFCCERYKYLLEFVNGLNALTPPLSWRSLGEVVRRSYRQRELSPHVLEIEMYGTELRLENHSPQQQRYLIRRRESEPSHIKDIRAGSRPLSWTFSAGYVHFELELEPDQETIIRFEFRELVGNRDGKEYLSYRVKTRLRRYLSEVRDNYIVKNKLNFSGFS
jgi:hypothetical protein